MRDRVDGIVLKREFKESGDVATAQARKAAEILLVSEVADRYLTLLADDELLAMTHRTLESAQASYAQQADAAITPDGGGLFGSRVPKLDKGPPQIRGEGDLG